MENLHKPYQAVVGWIEKNRDVNTGGTVYFQHSATSTLSEAIQKAKEAGTTGGFVEATNQHAHLPKKTTLP